MTTLINSLMIILLIITICPILRPDLSTLYYLWSCLSVSFNFFNILYWLSHLYFFSLTIRLIFYNISIIRPSVWFDSQQKNVHVVFVSVSCVSMHIKDFWVCLSTHIKEFYFLHTANTPCLLGRRKPSKDAGRRPAIQRVYISILFHSKMVNMDAKLIRANIYKNCTVFVYVWVSFCIIFVVRWVLNDMSRKKTQKKKINQNSKK